jgi:ribosomal protein S18 acetylase RimI-like enzyme
MVHVRAATVSDAAELVRLRRLMFATMRGIDEPGEWEDTARNQLEAQLRVPDRRLGAFVIDGDERRLAACSVGTVEERLAAPVHPAGRFGFVFNVCTDAAFRRRGYARATTVALLDWFAARGVTRVDLHATPDSEAMYRALGFAEHSVALSLDLSKR